MKIQKSGNKARFPGESGKEKTSVCTGFANLPPAWWICVGSKPRIFPDQDTPTSFAGGSFAGGGR
ncbi:MAG: hypothetical protein SO002_04885, partial [Candidatus Faecousia sp.]|nr:hypothetical protein [Candidatus Faecousia sp.]